MLPNWLKCLFHKPQRPIRTERRPICFLPDVQVLGDRILPAITATFTPATLQAFQITAASLGFALFLAFYVVCAGITWACYLRTGDEHAPVLLLDGHLAFGLSRLVDHLIDLQA